MAAEENAATERVPPLNLTADERDELLDILKTTEDFRTETEEMNSLISKVEGLYGNGGAA